MITQHFDLIYSIPYKCINLLHNYTITIIIYQRRQEVVNALHRIRLEDVRIAWMVTNARTEGFVVRIWKNVFIQGKAATSLLPDAVVVGIQSIQQNVNVPTKTFQQNGDTQLAKHEKQSIRRSILFDCIIISMPNRYTSNVIFIEMPSMYIGHKVSYEAL